MTNLKSKTTASVAAGWRRALLAALVAFAGLVAFYYAFCNLPRHSPEWTAGKIDLAIDRGLEFLCNSGAFQRRYGFGGEHRVHHYLTEFVLEKEPHARLGTQLRECDRISQDLPKWRAFEGWPGMPAPQLDAARRQEIQSLILTDPQPYARWLLWAIHASWAKLKPEDHETLFRKTSLQRGSYDLTHALIAYWIMLRTAPEVSERLHVRELVQAINARTLRYSTWAPRCSDGFMERTAFLLMQESPPKIPRRWIERILTVQQEDGGWMWVPPWSRSIVEMLGLPISSHTSEAHPTFLALVALSCYREQLRTEGILPARR